MAKNYYFVSDLHMGGDGQLQECDYTQEFVQWLKELALDPDAELIIMGDTFGLWEYTLGSGVARMQDIIDHHAPIFNQLREMGKSMPITMMVGNHDYDLACDPVYAEVLAGYNIKVNRDLSQWREIGGRKIWLEHGQQEDFFNASPDYGNKFALPIGYFITEVAVSGASRLSKFGRGNWLKDIRSVGTTQIPDWIVSNYFYREMSGVIRWILIPFLFFLSVAVLVLFGMILTQLGIWDVNLFLNNRFLNRLGFVGDILRLILFIDLIILLVMLIIAVPLTFILRDVKSTLERFKLLGGEASNELGGSISGNAIYEKRANQVFDEHPEAVVYIFGHTHGAYLSELQPGKVILNTGTWIKILSRVPVRFGWLPAVYYPGFRLNYWKISGGEGVDAKGNVPIIVEYVERNKIPQIETTWLQRTMLMGRRPAPFPAIPAKTVL